MDAYSYDKKELESALDKAKVRIIMSLVNEGHITYSEGEKWCKTHTLIMTETKVFRTLTRLWSKILGRKEHEGAYITVVKRTD